VKLALVRQEYTPYGGAERFLEQAIPAVQGFGVDITVIARHWPASDPQRVLICNPPYAGSLARDWGFARSVQRILRSGQFDLVQSHERIPGCEIFRAGDGVHAEWLRQRARILGIAGRARLMLNPYHAYVKAAERAMFLSPRLRAVICNSHMVEQEIQEHFGVDESRLHVIHNGVDTEKFHPDLGKEHRAAGRARLGWTDDDLVLLLVGSGFERKGVGVVLEALRNLSANVKLIVVGKDKRLGRYRAQVKQLGLDSRVHFSGAQKDVLPYYGAADIFVLPALYEPFPNVVLEALASGLPVITSTKCGARELIENGHEGYVIDALDVSALSSAVTSLADPGHLRAAKHAARQRAGGFSWNAMAKRFHELYRDLLAPRSG
jgi:UDP-glucose:(heptosyl)LPS alpha-1,3-glucosyltransferase